MSYRTEFPEHKADRESQCAKGLTVTHQSGILGNRGRVNRPRELDHVEIRSVTKAVRLLEALAKEPGPQGVSELARQLKMDKSSVSRMLRTLEQGRLVASDEASGKYALGLGLVHLGQEALRRLDLRTVGRDSLVALAKQTHECAHLAVRAGDRALYIAQELPGHGANVNVPVGALAPLYCTAR